MKLPKEAEEMVTKFQADLAEKARIKSSSAPTGYVAVPISELQKLEESRQALYEILSDAIRDDIPLQITLQNAVTDQMWRVANTKDWTTT